MKRLLLAVIAATLLLAQTTKVVELDRADQQHLQKCWSAKQQADADWDEAQKFMARKYGPLLNESDAKHEISPESLEYSEGFRFVLKRAGGDGTITGVGRWSPVTAPVSIESGGILAAHQ